MRGALDANGPAMKKTAKIRVERQAKHRAVHPPFD